MPSESRRTTRISIALPRILTIPLMMIPPFLAGSSANEAQTVAHDQNQTLRNEVRAAHAGGDAQAYLKQSRKLFEFLNGSPNSILQVMSAEAFAGDEASALNSFERFIQMGQSNERVLQATQFDAIRKSPRFLSLKREMATNTKRVSRASEVIRMPDVGMVPEDIDFDRRTRRFYVTSVINKEIMSFDLTGHFRRFARAPDSWPMMAIKVDSHRRILWATEVAIQGFASVSKSDWGTSAVLIYDLDSGKMIDRIPGPPRSTLGDMALTKDGDAIVSDNDEGVLYRLHWKSHSFERLDATNFVTPQTAAVSSDGRYVFVPDYLRGIGVVDLSTKQVSWLNSEGVHALSGIDGLYIYDGTLIATQNGTSPERVVRFSLDQSLMHVKSELVIERSTSSLGDPTHGVIVNGAFYYIANSGWDTLEDDGRPKVGSKPSGALLMCVDLRAKLK